jgi:hypothetical protein
MAKDQVE